MSLDTYNAKRNFDRTKEPRGASAKQSSQSFVIQKHAARRLHYDFRLEMNGVLKSWAVTRGPSLYPGDKRLAVHVEDHPLDYGGFEGNIPKGEYGGGSVIIWDRGTWSPKFDPDKMYAKGHMEFDLLGEKLHGSWHLVRMQKRQGEKRENWLLIKGEDQHARPEGSKDILEEKPNSVLTERPVEALTGEEPGWSSKTGRLKPDQKPKRKTTSDYTGVSKLKSAVKSDTPAFIEPQLATLTDKPPSGEKWLHEVKFDGYRLQARIDEGTAKLFTRSGLDWTRKFGKGIAAALGSLAVKSAIIDGELIVEGATGAADFSALQADLSGGRTDRLAYYAFDLFHLDGMDIRDCPLLERKAVLEKVMADAPPVLRFSSHFLDDGARVLEHACRLGLEGIISKLGDAPYRSGRSKGWLKSKCSLRQEFVIAGYVPSTAYQRAVGSLVLGVYDDGTLIHVGRVGTGFSATIAAELYKRLEDLKTTTSPFAEKLSPVQAESVRYCKPTIVAEVEFAAWTVDGNVRHASFRGLRDDKPAKDVARETGSATVKAAEPRGRNVKLTHPERLYWPEEGVTKEGLANYYTDVWPFISPFIVNRPLALLRCPEGIAGQSFFQKHGWKGMANEIGLFHDPQDDPDEKLITINSLGGLLGLVQGAALEIHPWGATVKDIERPDIIIMDLDPGENVAWSDIIRAALDVKARLEAAGLVAFVKTSGGKGLHVCSPIKPPADWVRTKAFTKGIAEAMKNHDPTRFVSTVSKPQRRGKILVDYLRNGRGATAVAPYSTRARPGAAVSMPIAWEELNDLGGPAHFTVLNVMNRLSRMKNDPWANFRASAATIR